MLQLRDIYKTFGDSVIYSDFNIEFREGVTTCILGPSGCGKTTLLNIIGGLLNPDAGTLQGFDNKRFAYIFQEPRLLPWKTVKQNTAFVADNDNIDGFLKLVDLQDYADKYPSQLSGGMSQRVSIARALAVEPDIILMDEPFSSLDCILKKNIIDKFKNILETERKTVIYVTHDIDEAITMSDDIYVLSKSPVKIMFEEKDIKNFGNERIKKKIISVL